MNINYYSLIRLYLFSKLLYGWFMDSMVPSVVGEERESMKMMNMNSIFSLIFLK